MNGCCSSSFVLFLSLGVFRRQQSTKFMRSLLPLVSLGGSRFTMHCMARWCFIRKKGGSPSTSSMATMPSDQMSTFSSYGSFLINSGAIQAGVPTNDFLLRISLVSWIANPKSAILTSPCRLMSTLSLLRSRCSCLRLCKLSSPSSIFFRIYAMMFSGTFLRQQQTKSTMAPPSMNSTNMNNDSLQQQVKQWRVRLAELHRFITAISVRILFRVRSSLSFMMRQAQYFRLASARSQAKKTLHIAPFPSYFWKMNSLAGFFSMKWTFFIMAQNSLVDSSSASM